MTLNISSLSLILELFIIQISAYKAAFGSDNETDYQALLAIKIQISSAESFDALSSWNDMIHFCTWHGVACRKKHRRRDNTSRDLSLVEAKNSCCVQEAALASSTKDNNPKLTYWELSQATDRFPTRKLIGEGSFGAVYKGILPSTGQIVAIKVLKLQERGATKSFMAKCKAMRNIRHQNLVKTITSC
ncbi:LRR receptor-like serine/threonine-protein kinase EFR [Punica granatum]|uniref:LRR receptor-like serine/threonine-protein kinase EFR n=1 Tax=Punica granatum TaxID=22663 RepID=A0A6P8DU88_PUNGR|nr:LRR receptor-like serine/threonine-protein kinase EFR [Punica granatum]